MPRPHTTMRKIRYVLQLRLGEGRSFRQIALAVSLPRTTVRDCVDRALAAGLSWPLDESLDDDALDRLLYAVGPSANTTTPLPDYATVQVELRQKGVTLQLLWLEYRELHPTGYGYSQFCHHYRIWRQRRDVVMRQDHKAGEKMFVDFPGVTIPIYDERTLEVNFRAELFVAVLGASSYLFATALRSQQLEHWVGAHVRAFEFFGGCPEVVVPDNLKSAVTKVHRYEPDVNATYQEMATHYGVAIIPARPYKPRDKAKVEAGVQLAERWIIAVLRHERFTSLGALNNRVCELVERINDKPFKKIAGSRASLFGEIDAPALRALPDDPYEFALWRAAKVNIDYHVEVDQHFYSVPYHHAGAVLQVRLSAATVELFFNNRRVASHRRSYERARHVTDPAHMPDAHRRYAEWTPSRIVTWAERNGPHTAQFISALMASRPHREQGFRSALGVLRLATTYSPERLELACAKALAVHSLSYRSVESMLKHGLEQRAVVRSARSHRPHANIRGPRNYQ